jgi:DNA replicative helicase MCM subunit Mcm2 (Cdc46/Mcm family)
MKIKFSTISIYGRNEIKQIIQMALNSEQPVHVLLTGEPGCGKTQFLENIKEYYKHRAYFTIGAHSTKTGMKKPAAIDLFYKRLLGLS